MSISVPVGSEIEPPRKVAFLEDPYHDSEHGRQADDAEHQGLHRYEQRAKQEEKDQKRGTDHEQHRQRQVVADDRGRVHQAGRGSTDQDGEGRGAVTDGMNEFLSRRRQAVAFGDDRIPDAVAVAELGQIAGRSGDRSSVDDRCH